MPSTPLTGQFPKNDYADLMQIGNGGVGLTGTLKQVCDGLANLTGIWLSTAAVQVTLPATFTAGITGAFTGNVTGNLTGNVAGSVTGNVTGNLTGNVTGNVSGNAGTVTNGAYVNAAQTWLLGQLFKGPSPYYDADAWGADPTGVLDSAPALRAINAAIVATPGRSGTIRLTDGAQYRLDSTVQLGTGFNNSFVQMVGNNTRFTYGSNDSGPVFRWNQLAYCKHEGYIIDGGGSGVANGLVGIYVIGFSDVVHIHGAGATMTLTTALSHGIGNGTVVKLANLTGPYSGLNGNYTVSGVTSTTMNVTISPSSFDADVSGWVTPNANIGGTTSYGMRLLGISIQNCHIGMRVGNFNWDAGSEYTWICCGFGSCDNGVYCDGYNALDFWFYNISMGRNTIGINAGLSSGFFHIHGCSCSLNGTDFAFTTGQGAVISEYRSELCTVQSILIAASSSTPVNLTMQGCAIINDAGINSIFAYGAWSIKANACYFGGPIVLDQVNNNTSAVSLDGCAIWDGTSLFQNVTVNGSNVATLQAAVKSPFQAGDLITVYGIATNTFLNGDWTVTSNTFDTGSNQWFLKFGIAHTSVSVVFDPGFVSFNKTQVQKWDFAVQFSNESYGIKYDFTGNRFVRRDGITQAGTNGDAPDIHGSSSVVSGVPVKVNAVQIAPYPYGQAAINPNEYAITDASVIVWDVGSSPQAYLAPTASGHLVTVSNLVIGKKSLRIVQGLTPYSMNFDYPIVVDAGGTIITLNQTALSENLLEFYCNGSALLLTKNTSRSMQDFFDRFVGSGGTLLSAHTMDSGHGWTAALGVGEFVLKNTQTLPYSMITGAATSTAPGICNVTDAESPNCIIIAYGDGVGGADAVMGLMVRYVSDTDYWLLVWDSGDPGHSLPNGYFGQGIGIGIVQYISGTAHVRAWSTAGPAANGFIGAGKGSKWEATLDGPKLMLTVIPYGSGDASRVEYDSATTGQTSSIIGIWGIDLYTAFEGGFSPIYVKLLGGTARAGTEGSLAVPGTQGAPTGTPNVGTGETAIKADQLNNLLYFYGGGAWNQFVNRVKRIRLTGQTSTISASTLFTPPADGEYQFSFVLKNTVNGSAGTAVIALIWSDETTSNSVNLATLALSTANQFQDGIKVIHAIAGQAIQYSVTVAGATGSPQFSVSLDLVRL